MTTKKMLSQDTFKVMEENETIVEIKKWQRGIYYPWSFATQSIKKSRESYKFENSLVEIDINDKSFCPFPYIEIETSDMENLKEIVNF